MNESDPTGFSASDDAIETDYFKGTNKDNILNVKSSHFLPWAVGHLIFYDWYVMTGRTIAQAFPEARQDLREIATTSQDPTQRAAADAAIPLVYFGQVSAHVSVVEGQAGTYMVPIAGVSAAPAALIRFGKPLLTGVTLLGTAGQAAHVGGNLLTREGRDALTVEDWVDLGFGAYASWDLTGRIPQLNPLNYRLAIVGASEEGRYVLGSMRFFRYKGPPAVNAALDARVLREVTPAEAGLAGGGGRLGNVATRLLNDRLATSLEAAGYSITGGGGRVPEEWIPGPGGGKIGGTFVDITATNGASTVRIQTIDTLSDGITPTPDEAAAAARIRVAFPGDRLTLIPKR